MNRTVKIICENNSTVLSVEMGSSLSDVLKIVALKNDFPFLAACVNNKFKELDYEIYKPVSIRFIDITHFEGMRVYQRTLFFILQKAVYDLYPENKLHIRHSVAKGFYCEIEGMEDISAEQISEINRRMRELIAQNIPIVGERVLESEAEQIYRQFGFDDKIALLRTRPHLYIKLYTLGGVPGYFYGAMCQSTGEVKLFDLRKYYQGIYVAVPVRFDPEQLEKMIPQDKMFDIFNEYKSWTNILGVSNVGSINSLIINKKAPEMIKIAEALQEKRCAKIADMIAQRYGDGGARIVLLSGPSSSGKTTTSKRISIQLRVWGFRPVVISLDDYFLNREQTPIDENGEYDFEAIEALDVAQFNRDLLDLLAGKMVNLPTFDFHKGERVMNPEKKIQLDKASIIVIEGIHALNPILTQQIDPKQKFKIYVSALTSVSMDNMNRIATTDNRLLRRMVRDYAYRGVSGVNTLRRWESVRRGEEKHIFPYQEQADVMFNSALFFEISVLKSFAERILYEVPTNVPEYGEARRLEKLLDHFIAIGTEGIPPTSILREFIGGSSFEY